MPEQTTDGSGRRVAAALSAAGQAPEKSNGRCRPLSLCSLNLKELVFSPSRQDTLNASEYRFLVSLDFMYRLGVLAHLLFIPLFAALGANLLALYNILSVSVFLFSTFANRLGHQTAALVAALAEIITHAALATYTVGWDSGFQYYLVAAVPAVFLHPTWRTSIQFGAAAFIIAAYLTIDHIALPVMPLVDVTRVIHPLQHFNVLGAMLFIAFLAWSYRKATSEVETTLQNVLSSYDKLAHTDPLTGLPNRRAAREFLHAEESRFKRSGRPFVVAIADLDDFKTINDRYGHDVGDKVLQTVANSITHTLRHHDFAARWGGEEFLMILPETGLDQGRQALNKICDRIQRASHAASQAKPVTMTIGFSIYDGSDSIDGILKEADKALYQGKQAGKNRVWALHSRPEPGQ